MKAPKTDNTSYDSDEIDQVEIDRFFEAIKNNDLKTIATMGAANPDLIESRKLCFGNNSLTPIIYACSIKETTPETIRKLGEYGADFDAKSDRGFTALHMALIAPRPDLIRPILESYKLSLIDFDELKEEQAENKVKEYLLSPVKIDEELLASPLHLAASTIQKDFIVFLIKNYGVNPNQQIPGSGDTPAQACISSAKNRFPDWSKEKIRLGTISTLMVLAENGADLTIKNKNGEAPINYLTFKDKEELRKLPKTKNSKNDKGCSIS